MYSAFKISLLKQSEKELEIEVFEQKNASSGTPSKDGMTEGRITKDGTIKRWNDKKVGQSRGRLIKRQVDRKVC